MLHAPPSTDVQAVNKSRYGKPRKPVHWSNVHCTGNEQQITSCESHKFETLEDKKTILSHVNVAGVMCRTAAVVTPTTMNKSNDTDSVISSEQASGVLIAPTYLTMLMMIANLALSIM